MRYHFVITVEPVPAFCRMACLWAWSLRRHAGALADSRLFVVFNDWTDPDTEEWLRRVHRDQTHPLGMMRRAWNTLWAGCPGGERFMIGWHVRRKRFADQAAVFPAALKLRLSYRVLPHEFNWRFRDTVRPDETPRLIHYYKSALGIPPSRILQEDWIPAYRESGDVGRRALANVVGEFLQQHLECPHRAAP